MIIISLLGYLPVKLIVQALTKLPPWVAKRMKERKTTTKLHKTLLSFVHGALHLPLEPVHNARLVELAEAVEAGEGLAHLILLHANRAFGHAAIVSEAVLLSRRK